MGSRKGVLLTFLVVVAVCVAVVAAADTVTCSPKQGKAYLTVQASDKDIYTVELTLQRGAFHDCRAPAGWAAEIVTDPATGRDRILRFTTATNPVKPGAENALSGFMAKISGSGRHTSWVTTHADGTQSLGSLNLR